MSFLTMCFSMKGATKLYFAHHSYVVIIFFNADLDESAFSTYSFGKLVHCLCSFSVFSDSFIFRYYLHKRFNLISFILYAIRVWSLFYSVWVYIRLYFVPVCTSFCVLVSCVSLSLTIHFFVVYFEFDVISKNSTIAIYNQ